MRTQAVIPDATAQLGSDEADLEAQLLLQPSRVCKMILFAHQRAYRWANCVWPPYKTQHIK